MAGAVRIDLDHGHADLFHAFGVDRSGDVAFDHRRPETPLQVGEEGFEQSGLARPGRAHHVQAEDAGGVQRRAIFGGKLVVHFEDFFGGDDFHGAHSSTSMLCSISSRPPSMLISLLAQRGHWTTRSSISNCAWQAWQWQTALGSWITSSASLDPRAGGEQAEGEADGLAQDARQPADAQFQSQDPSLLAGTLKLLPHLIDQRLDDGQLVHGTGLPLF